MTDLILRFTKSVTKNIDVVPTEKIIDHKGTYPEQPTIMQANNEVVQHWVRILMGVLAVLLDHTVKSVRLVKTTRWLVHASVPELN
jgi:hypothetical protein